MKPSFRAGAMNTMKEFARKAMGDPAIRGSLTGAALGFVVAPQDDRFRYTAAGAGIGYALGDWRAAKKMKQGIIV